MTSPRINELLASAELARVRAYAELSHGSQLYGALPYVFHLDQVVAAIAGAEELCDLDSLKAGYCHDIEEDVEGATREGVSSVIGSVAEELVYCCTGEGDNRAARQASIVRKLTENRKSVLVKLADRVCNMERCFVEQNFKMLAKYVKEIPLYEPLFKESDPGLYGRFISFNSR